MAKDLKFFHIAKKALSKSTYHQKLGAVIVKKNRVIGVGYNKPGKTHPKSSNIFRTIHAELDAVLGCDKEDLKGATIYVLRESNRGSLLAKPCPCCMDLIRMVGIKKVIYSTNQGFAELYL